MHILFSPRDVACDFPSRARSSCRVASISALTHGKTWRRDGKLMVRAVAALPRRLPSPPLLCANAERRVIVDIDNELFTFNFTSRLLYARARSRFYFETHAARNSPSLSLPAVSRTRLVTRILPLEPCAAGVGYVMIQCNHCFIFATLLVQPLARLRSGSSSRVLASLAR